VTLGNQATAAAASSVTTVAFSSGQKVSQTTPSLPPNDAVDLFFNIPSGCFSPDSRFTITVDSDDEITEINESDNRADDFRLG
jgi:subtilase family serine protease